MEGTNEIPKYHYRYYVYAITGPRGYCDSDCYLSDKYYEEEKCQKGLNSFVPYWSHIRSVRDNHIIKYDDKTGKEISRYDIFKHKILTINSEMSPELKEEMDKSEKRRNYNSLDEFVKEEGIETVLEWLSRSPTEMGDFYRHTKMRTVNYIVKKSDHKKL